MDHREERDDFDPAFWGPLTWKVLFLNALSYPDSKPTLTERTHFGMYYNSLQTILPCHKCRDGTKKFLRSNPVEPHLRSRIELLKWLAELYNEKRPPHLQVRNLEDLRGVIKGEETVNEVIDEIASKYPNTTFRTF